MAPALQAAIGYPLSICRVMKLSTRAPTVAQPSASNLPENMRAISNLHARTKIEKRGNIALLAVQQQSASCRAGALYNSALVLPMQELGRERDRASRRHAGCASVLVSAAYAGSHKKRASAQAMAKYILVALLEVPQSARAQMPWRNRAASRWRGAGGVAQA